MKFILASTLLTLALAMGIQGSIIPLHSDIAGHGLAYTATGPALLPAAVHTAHVVAHGPIAHVDAWGHDDGQWHGDAHWDHGHWDDGHWAHGHGHWGHNVVIAAPAPKVIVAHAPAHEGVYVAKTRGALHTAPLSGHAKSAASINLAPAPGTV